MKPTLLIILDGWGERAEHEHNSIHLATTNHYDRFLHNYPHTTVLTHGTAVGLTEGVMGNSEVGHMNIGAGRIVMQTLSRISQAIDNGAFFENEALHTAMQACIEHNSTLHLMGLLSDAGVHSDISHLVALLRMAANNKISNVCIHPFMDGRDTNPRRGVEYLHRLQDTLNSLQIGRIATVSGRYYSMDRDKRWDRTERAYQALVLGKGARSENDAATIVNDWYHQSNPQPGFGDEFVPPTVLIDPATKQPIGLIEENDVVIHFNFRPDRARQLTQALSDPDFSEFERQSFPVLSNFTCMAPYSENFDLPIAFRKEKLARIMGEIIAEQGMAQFRCAETEKYAHVTYFFNGGVEQVFPGEERKLVPSNREIATYDLAPEMRAREVTAEVLNALNTNKFGFYVINFANPDMVGHTGKEPAAIQAVEALDDCLGQIVDQVLQQDGIVIITADHGNCEEMIDAHGHPHTQHTLNPVPCIIIGNSVKELKLKPGRLCDIAPTLLELMGIEQPPEMTGESLIIH